MGKSSRFLPPYVKLFKRHYTSKGDADSVKALIAAGAEVNAWDLEHHRRTVLMHAARDGSIDCIKALIAAGADVNAKSSMGDTALMYATRNATYVKALIGAGADVNAKTNKGWTAILSAASKGNAESVNALIAAGADVNARCLDGDTVLTALELARDHPDIIAALKAAGAESLSRDPNELIGVVDHLRSMSKEMRGEGLAASGSARQTVQCSDCGDWRGMVPIFKCSKCSIGVSFSLNNLLHLDQNSELHVSCPNCHQIVHIPQSVLCKKCGKGLTRGWQEKIVAIC
jgi:hypothetical protein